MDDHRASKTTSWNPQDRGRSLVSMRTFYAYGARSSSIGGRSSSVCPSTFPAHYNAPGYSHRSLRSSVAPVDISPSPFMRNTASRATISSSCIRSLPKPSYRSSYETPVRSPSYTRMRTPSRVFSPIERVRPSTRVTSPVIYSSPDRLPRSEASASRISIAESRPISVIDPPSTPVISTPVPTLDERSLMELDDLRSRNQKLEEELARLQLMIKDGDRSNRELKRRLLESEAETKVWQTKAERVVEPQIIEVVRPSKPEVVVRHQPIDDTLYDKLEFTADKLAALNAVNDLKMLQSHIESALTEITSK